jgi:microcystin-dependent protein
MRLFLAALFWFYSSVVGAATICASVPFTFINGVTADGTQVNANFAALISCVNTYAAHNGANSDIASLSALTSGSLILPGQYAWTAATNIDPGFLACDGSAVSRTTYASLFSAIGTTYGAGDGSTTFNVPDLQGRVLASVEGTTGRLTGADSVGEVVGVQSSVVQQANLANFSLPASATFSLLASGTNGGRHEFGTVGEYTLIWQNSNGVGVGFNLPLVGTITPSVTSGGSGTPLPTVQPTMAAQCEIKY